MPKCTTFSYMFVLIMNDHISRAQSFAIMAHGRLDHRRKYSFEPYPVHLKAVAELVTSVSDDAEIIAAAWLHDTVEDTAITLSEVDARFGSSVACLVGALTLPKPVSGRKR